MVAIAAKRVKTERARLYDRFQSVIQPNPRLTRSLVSFQANRREKGFSWFKYKEAFSAELARFFIEEYAKPDDSVLDPFAGVGTALLVSRAAGRDSIGIELLPVGAFVIDARLSAEAVNRRTFDRYFEEARATDWAKWFERDYAFQHLRITRKAFSAETEQAIGGYRAFCDKRIRDAKVRKLFCLAGLAVLESVSFTRKDGQYLRWDHRAGKPRVRASFDKGEVPSFATAIGPKLIEIQSHLGQKTNGSSLLFEKPSRPGVNQGTVDLRIGSCLELLPTLSDESVGLVLTSPPYCNRYDYTRTYALELAYLGYGEDDVRQLRQTMLTCTVENREKTDGLHSLYEQLGGRERFERVRRTFDAQTALHEVLDILDQAARSGSLNNSNIPRMVRNYFLEMCLVIHELARVVRPGGCVVMVNDNVRYQGEEVPVDLILADFAQQFGMSVEHIWTLPRGKGNSSQQMGEHGRSELRKCVYVWRKMES